MDPLLHDLVALGFGGRIPDLFEALVDWPQAEAHRLAFKAGPILSLRGDAPPRAFLADVGEPDAFTQRLARVLGADLASFRLSVPDARAMIDTDGTRAELYLDDLHLADHDVTSTVTGEVLCAVKGWGGAADSTFLRHGPPPRSHLDDVWLGHLDDLLAAGFEGMWATRWRDRQVAGLLWINDDRWHGDAQATARLLDALPEPAWHAVRERARHSGLAAYPDSLELQRDGRWEVTVGLVEP